MRKGRKNRGDIITNKKSDLIVHDDPKAIGSEAFRTLRTNLQFTSPDREIKSILVTSVGPGDGKSTVSANLAVAWSQSGAKVALIGCDLRKPVLHHLFPVRNSPGLTGLLSGAASFDDVIQPSGIPGLDIIPAGPTPPNPAELLQSQTMSITIKRLEASYDIIIFDGTPVVAVTDAAVMSNQADGIVLVIQANKVPKDLAVHAKELLEQAHANILGVVLNKVRYHDSKKYYYYYYNDDLELAK